MKLKLTILLSLVTLVVASTALAQCDISGNITASANPDSEGPAWMYTLTINWDTDVQYALSHMDLIIDSEGGTCTLSDIAAHLFWDPIIGTSDGEGGCTVSYFGELSGNGDPSIPGIGGIILKFEPNGGDCEPGNVGTATFVFYSDLPPVPVDEDALSLVDKYSLYYCMGHLTGVFPGYACDPVDNEATNFGTLKGMFR
ncbi:hypothetical protein COW53_04220 [bacterium CG17_big_fil_post_rev_8_21_14_2_50_64_8]|nr:MAG: hypothetical protein COW53_04220 [bacterium CG17_big_fil_post_rev_8_21_14_2_50_64_8]PJA73363.1 MAG: hypothetical protein CO151_13440 [bacterium CG_4_9_14_3_um_filter_65_15]